MEVLNESEGVSVQDCIDACVACYQDCLKCLNHCLIMGGVHSHVNHITTMIECAEICKTSSTLMSLKGKFSYEICQVCARVCDACEASCLTIGSDDSMMLDCAESCRRCADTCRSMAH